MDQTDAEKRADLFRVYVLRGRGLMTQGRPYWSALRSVGISYDYAFRINLTILSDAESRNTLRRSTLQFQSTTA